MNQYHWSRVRNTFHSFWSVRIYFEQFRATQINILAGFFFLHSTHYSNHLWTIFFENTRIFFILFIHYYLDIFRFEHQASSDIRFESIRRYIDDDRRRHKVHICFVLYLDIYVAKGPFAQDTRLRSIFRHLNFCLSHGMLKYNTQHSSFKHYTCHLPHIF